MAVTRHANRRRTSKTQMFVSHAHALKTTKPIMEYYKVDVSNPSPTFKSMSNISWSPCGLTLFASAECLQSVFNKD